MSTYERDTFRVNGDVVALRDSGAARFDKSQSLTAAQAAQARANIGAAELDANGKVPSSQLPSYVDDVLEYASESAFPATGETGKIYVDLSTNLTYRWSGTAYVEISPSLALGETSSTAYRGDRGADAYAHGVTNKGSAFASGLYKITTNAEGHVTAAVAAAKGDIGLGNVDNTSDASKPVSTATQTALDGKLSLFQGAGFHNSIYRGAYLGASVTAEQWAAISAGTFDGLFIGDYWTIGGVNWRIAAFDYWYGFGDTACNTHHAVIVPDSNLNEADGSTTHWMNATSITTGAYVGSDWRTGNNSNGGRAACVSKIESAFGSGHILTYRGYLANAITNPSGDIAYESGVAWYDCTVEIMNERMVYGCDIFHNVMASGVIPSLFSIDHSQLPLFAHNRRHICNRAVWYLRDVISTTFFASVANEGQCNNNGAASVWVGVRPAFGIRA